MPLQVLDVLGDGGLRQVQIFRCPGVVEGLAQVQKRIIAEIQHSGPPSPACFRPYLLVIINDPLVPGKENFPFSPKTIGFPNGSIGIYRLKGLPGRDIIKASCKILL